MSTQWRTGMAGATGLDYSAIQPTLALLGVPRASWPDVFIDLRILEGAALGQMRENAK